VHAWAVRNLTGARHSGRGLSRRPWTGQWPTIIKLACLEAADRACPDPHVMYYSWPAYGSTSTMTPYTSLDMADKVWYFAYGSNMKSSVMERRGMKPLAVKQLVIPSHVLTFDIFGVPYTEPAMASIAERETLTGPQRAGRDKHQQPPPPVHGIGYLLSAGDFKNLVVSEGAGTAYTEVELQAQILGPSERGGDSLPVRTLVGRYPFRPNPLPSARYLVRRRSLRGILCDPGK